MLRLFLIVAAFFTASAALADDLRYQTEYSITLAGLTVAKANFVTEVERRNYTISGSFRAAGIADLFTDISGETSVSGRLAARNRMVAQRYSLIYKSGKSTKTYNVRYRNGDVVHTTLEPAPGNRGENWIPIAPEDLKSVLDPISGLIMTENDRICPRTLPIYDGESRMDLVMTPKGTGQMKVNDSNTDVVICAIRYVPKSGFKRGRDDIEYLRKQSNMEIWFAKTGNLKLYAPVYAQVPTRVGPLRITAVNFGG